MTSQLRRRRGVMKKARSASAVPPVVGQNSFCMRFSALVAAVVFTASVEVDVALPLMVTGVGLRLQVGGSLAPAGDAVVAHARATEPVKP